MIIRNLVFMVLRNGSRGNFDIREVMEIKRSVSVDVQRVCFQLCFLSQEGKDSQASRYVMS